MHGIDELAGNGLCVMDNATSSVWIIGDWPADAPGYFRQVPSNPWGFGVSPTNRSLYITIRKLLNILPKLLHKKPH